MPDRPEYPSVPENALQGSVRTNLDSPNPSPEQIARRERSLGVLKRLGVPYLASLPVTEDEATIVPRKAEEIARRCVAVAICAVKGETGDHALAQELIARYKASELFSPQEREFIRDPAPRKQLLIDFTWQYEALHVLLWSLGHVKELKPPNQICDVQSEVGSIRDLGLEGLTSKAAVRSVAEILNQADLYYHLHWSAIELRLRGQSSEALDEGIIRERHRALNWLIRYMGQEWDDVGTDT